MHGNILAVLLCVLFLLNHVSSKTVTMFYDQEITSDTCYNRYGRPHRCLPEFKNIAYQRKIKVTHTCGEDGPRKFCKSHYEGCGTCDAKDSTLAHPPSYLTDLNNPSDLTCWQTDPLDNSQQNVTLILSLGKQFDITYINLEFCSFRPDAMAIYKSNDFGRSWTPYQYYADHCMHMFHKSTRGIVSHGNEVFWICFLLIRTTCYSDFLLPPERHQHEHKILRPRHKRHTFHRIYSTLAQSSLRLTTMNNLHFGKFSVYT